MNVYDSAAWRICARWAIAPSDDARMPTWSSSTPVIIREKAAEKVYSELAG